MVRRYPIKPYPITPTTRIPVIGPWIGRVGFVNQIMAMPCSPSPEVYVEAFFAGVPHMFWRAFKPTPLDAKYDMLKMGPGGSHGRKKFGFKGYAKDVNFKPGTFGWATFQAAELAQKVGWYILIADILTEQVVNWTSLAYEWSGCDQPYAGWASCRCNTTWPLSHLAGEASPLLWTENSSHIFGTTPVGISIPDGYDASCGGGITAGPIPGDPLPAAPWSMEIRETTTGTVLASSSSRDIGGGVSAATLFYRASHIWDFGKFYRLYITKGFGSMQITGGFMSASGTGQIMGLRPDP